MRPIHLASMSCALLLSIPAADAAITSHETVVHDTTTTVDLQLDDHTVICSALDYSSARLKVLIPALASLTLLDYQNLGAGAPCVAAGECAPFGDASPADILGDDPSETVDIRVKATRVDVVDDVAQTCDTSLTERVELEIRGVPFVHERWAALGSRPFSDCVAPVEGPKPDSYGAPVADEPAAPTSAGCSAAGSSGLAGLGFTLPLLGLVIRRRRVLSARR